MKKIIAAAGIGAALAVGSLTGIGTAQADAVTICGPGYGVSGSHTSCAFAANIRNSYVGSGNMLHFIAYSPVTNERFVVNCENTVINFPGGGAQYAEQCYAGDNAEAVVW